AWGDASLAIGTGARACGSGARRRSALSDLSPQIRRVTGAGTHTESLCRHTPKVGAVCGKTARTVLCGGRAMKRTSLPLRNCDFVAAKSLIDLVASRLALRAPALRAATALTRPTRSAQRLPSGRHAVPTAGRTSAKTTQARERSMMSRRSGGI